MPLFTSVFSLQIQVALRHKSEIEHHRNKIRLRAKRKGHYDFPAMDDVACGLANGKDEDQIYQKAQVDKMADAEAQMPMSIFTGSRKRSGRGKTRGGDPPRGGGLCERSLVLFLFQRSCKTLSQTEGEGAAERRRERSG